MHVRSAKASDAPAIAAIILPIIREAATYTLDPDMSETEALAYWMGRDKETFVAEEDGVVLGSYLDFGQFWRGSSSSWDAEHRIILDDLVSALKHELHAAEISEGAPPAPDV